MRKALFAATIAMAAANAGCDFLGLDDTEERTLEVAAYKGTCFGLFETLCLQVREPGEEDFLNMYETPGGFDYRWGFQYVIRVEERELDRVPADASSIRRTLKRVLSIEPATGGATFQVTVPAGRLQNDGQGQLEIRGEATLACPETLPCEELVALAEAEARLRLTLAFPQNPGDPLEVRQWVQCPEDFSPCPPM